MVEVYGVDYVGLFIGDMNINGNVCIVVMIIEVFWNMIYVDFVVLCDLWYVVMDEVYYLVDCFCGVVWEEVIIYFFVWVCLVLLSVMVLNVEEFGDWFDMVCGDIEVIVFEIWLVLLE